MSKNKLLSWYLFMRMGEISIGGLDPSLIRNFINAFDKLSEEEIISSLKEEFEESDLPKSIFEKKVTKVKTTKVKATKVKATKPQKDKNVVCSLVKLSKEISGPCVDCAHSKKHTIKEECDSPRVCCSMSVSCVDVEDEEFDEPKKKTEEKISDVKSLQNLLCHAGMSISTSQSKRYITQKIVKVDGCFKYDPREEIKIRENTIVSIGRGFSRIFNDGTWFDKE